MKYPMFYLHLRLKITSTLCNLFRSVIALTPDDLLPCLYLCLNKVHEYIEPFDQRIQ